jgi:hypothetical protein
MQRDVKRKDSDSVVDWERERDDTFWGLAAAKSKRTISLCLFVDRQGSYFTNQKQVSCLVAGFEELDHLQ